MPRQNRVRPDGELIAVPDRGLFWGNRGSLHNRDGRLVRQSRGRAWVICLLEFKGRRRQLWAPGRLTELFFLDEATGLAAGHRPCGECRNAEYRQFKAIWGTLFPDEPLNQPAIDAHLDADRRTDPPARAGAGSGTYAKRTYTEEIGALPAGTMITLDGQPWLLRAEHLLAWTPGSYRTRRRRPAEGEVTVLTPRATVAVLSAGYQPVLHPSASEG